VQTRRAGESRSELGALDLAAIQRVRDEQRANPRDADELHDALVVAGFLRDSEIDADAMAFVAGLTAARRACRVVLPPSPQGVHAEPIWVAAERIPEILAVQPTATPDPAIDPPRSRAQRSWTPDAALVELVRSRLTLVGPTTATALARSLAIDPRAADNALLALESEGVVLRGRFTPPVLREGRNLPVREPERGGQGDGDREWCDRALLARIHRYTLNRLRAEIEPVSPAAFMRFLFKWQHVDESDSSTGSGSSRAESRDDRLSGLDGLREALAMLDGFELAGAAWERSVLPARVEGYDPSMLDMLCLAGEVGWARLSPPGVLGPDPPRLAPATPVALFLRERGDGWLTLRPAVVEVERGLTENARRVLDALRAKGASFFGDLRNACGLDSDETRDALGSLVASGLAASDGFSGLRALLWRARGRPAAHDRRARFAGRWTTLAAAPPQELPRQKMNDALEAQAWALLHRYGVVFRRLLTRESLAAPWRDLARVYRRLEAGGDIRGGRFVSGMSGEQFALPHAVERLREIRRTAPDGRLLTISTADPLNLAGIVTAGDRVRVAGRNRLVYRDGVPLAVREGDEVRELAAIEPAIASDVARALGRPVPRAVPSQRAFAGGR
jgi:ATP-dependent Lhr-like helicase